LSTALTVTIAILVFGFLIFIHEFGHYITARIFKVTITEFSIGMGPKLLWYDSKKTGIRYSLAMLPIGGFVAMVGEDGESDDPNAFHKKPAWQRFIITAAGAAVNIIAGFLAMIVLTSLVRIGGTEVGRVVGAEGFTNADSIDFEVSNVTELLLPGDVIREVNGKSVVIRDEVSYEVMRHGHEAVTLTVLRGGEEITLTDVRFPVMESQGQVFGVFNISVRETKKNLGSVLSYSFRNAALQVRMVWESLYDLFSGRYTFAAVSGPVGISTAIGEAANAGFTQLLNIIIIISINLGVMNLLPIPALDGGRLITILIEMVTRKKIPPKIEGLINGIGLMVLLGLSLVIMVKDVIQLF
jgi:regulator of sigma E protease